jgi:hypothetical protein
MSEDPPADAPADVPAADVPAADVPAADVPAGDVPAEPLVEFDGLPSRLLSVGLSLCGLALVGAVVDGAVNGLTFGTLGRWVGLLAVALLVAAAITTALHALRGADRAGRRGERLSSPDVGLAPRRRDPGA